LFDGANLKSSMLKDYASENKDAAFHENHKNDDAFELMDRLPQMFNKHSEVYREGITTTKNLQSKVVELAMLNGKVQSRLHYPTRFESVQDIELRKQTQDFYRSFVSEAIKQQEVIERDEEAGWRLDLSF
jgi:hypothetical protein